MSVARALVTEAEFLSLPESMQRMELIDGEVYVPPSPHDVLRSSLLPGFELGLSIIFA